MRCWHRRSDGPQIFNQSWITSMACPRCPRHIAAVELQQHYKQRGNNHPSREDDESDDDFEAATISKRRQCQVMKCKCNKTSEQCHKCKLAVCGKCTNRTYKKWFAVIVRKSIQNQNHKNDNRINLFIRKL